MVSRRATARARSRRAPGKQGLARLTVHLVEVHGTRSRTAIRAPGQAPDQDDSLCIEDASPFVIEYRDGSADEGERRG